METMNKIQLTQHVIDKNYPEIHGITSLIERDSQGIMRASFENWNEETQSLDNHTNYMSELIDDDGNSFSGNPLDYPEYFPRTAGKYNFELNVTYKDIYTELKGIAVNHGVCITGCDRTKLKYSKKNEGLYQVILDLNRLEVYKTKQSAEEAIPEERRSPGGPIVQGKMSCD